MRNPTFCICENKDADLLRGNREADQRLCFRYIDRTIPLLSNSECTAWFVSDQVGNQKVGFLMTRLIYFNAFITGTALQPFITARWLAQ